MKSRRDFTAWCLANTFRMSMERFEKRYGNFMMFNDKWWKNGLQKAWIEFCETPKKHGIVEEQYMTDLEAAEEEVSKLQEKVKELERKLDEAQGVASVLPNILKENEELGAKLKRAVEALKEISMGNCLANCSGYEMCICKSDIADEALREIEGK